MRVVWTQTAATDLVHFQDSIDHQNPQAAANVVAALRRASERLLDFPESGRPGRLPDTRELLVPGLPYILPYTVSGDRIVIHDQAVGD